MGLTSIRCRSLAASFDYPLKVAVGLESPRRKVLMIRLHFGREVVQLVETLRPDVVLIDTLSSSAAPASVGTVYGEPAPRPAPFL